MKQPIIGFIGMTHLGLVSGVAASKKGFQIICFDQNPEIIKEINAGNLPVSEPLLQEYIEDNRNKIEFTSNQGLLNKCDVIYIAPDIPTDDHGNSGLEVIEKLIEFVFKLVREDVVIVVLSQVPPGFSRQRSFGRKFYYQVETLIFGRALERALYPERYIVGCANPEEELPKAYQIFLQSHDCPILKMRYESAELAKISINMCLVASVSTANTLAEICESIGADWTEIVPALKLDRRIGQYSYLSAGLGISGGNLERDLATVCRLGEEFGTDINIVRAWMANSGYRKNWPLRTLQVEVLEKKNSPVIAILGLAYKENTHSIKNSPAILLLENLKGYETRVYDPVVTSDMVSLGSKTYFASNILDACHDADVLLIMTPWDEFKKIQIQELVKHLRGNVIIDPYKILNREDCMQHMLSYHSLGVAQKRHS